MTKLYSILAGFVIFVVLVAGNIYQLREGAQVKKELQNTVSAYKALAIDAARVNTATVKRNKVEKKLQDGNRVEQNELNRSIETNKNWADTPVPPEVQDALN